MSPCVPSKVKSLGEKWIRGSRSAKDKPNGSYSMAVIGPEDTSVRISPLDVTSCFTSVFMFTIR